MKKQEESAEKYTKYEKARMIGARALQIAMGAPFLIKLSEAELENANIEFNEGATPITVRRPMPKSRFPTA
jgi:DNA-directed RNA polymerase subunit K